MPNLSNKELFLQFKGLSAGLNNPNARRIFGTKYQDKWNQLFCIEGLVLARMDGSKPPFSRGDNVVTSRQSLPEGDNLGSPVMKVGKRLRVRRLWYKGDGTWLIEFYSVCQSMIGSVSKYNASDFKIVSGCGIVPLTHPHE